MYIILVFYRIIKGGTVMATIKDIYALPENVRADLIDKKIYYHETPSTEHQEILTELLYKISTYTRNNKK